eukprot:TRINITY_DN1394_c0_g1_i12.p1 TRINITY_DN1394_c0_g1~~TRINITY_DN1394_c0_g1_i12.p1  ORF type:complete len:126 (-),score=63.34 TRINITY_DN1394_c0_g1_i12:124-477(-)
MIRRPPRSTRKESSAASDVYKRQVHGKLGELYYNTGERYEGEWQNNKKNGQGTLFYANGDVYEATWHNGKPAGKGKLIHANVNKISDERKEEELTKNQSNSDSAEDLKETYDDVCNN